MTCLCGFEADTSKFIEVKVAAYNYALDDTLHFSVRLPAPEQKPGHRAIPSDAYTFRRRMYSCPKCGTVKMEVEK